MAFVSLAVFVGQEALVTQARIVDEGDSRNPVATVGLAVAGDIVLTAGEIPHEIAPVHVVELVGEEVTHILRERGLLQLGSLQGIALGIHQHRSIHRGDVGLLNAGPLHIARRMRSCRAIHAREEHTWCHHVVLVAEVFGIAVSAVGGCLHCLGIDGGGRIFLITVVAGLVDLEKNGRLERRTVEQRSLAILLAAQVGAERKHVVGRVLVHRRIGVGADKQKRVARIADENHENAQRHECQHPHGEPLGGEEPYGESTHDNQRNQKRMADKGNAAKQHGEQKRDADAVDALLAVKRMDAPYGHGEDGIYKHARIEAPSESIYKEKLEILADLDEARHEAEEYQRHDDGRDGQGDERAGSGRVAELTVIDHKHNGRNAEKIEQVNGYRNADDIGDEHQIAVGVGLVGTVLPF